MPSTGTSTAPTPSGGTPRASARKKSRDSTTTATARPTTRTRKPDRASRRHGDYCRVCMGSSSVTRLQSVARRPHRQPSVDEVHGHRSFTHRGGAALARPLADVTGCEDARNAGSKHRLSPPFGSREDKAVPVPRDDIGEPVDAGQRAEGEEQEREGHALAAPELECDRLELAIRAVQFSDLAPIANYHAVALEVASEVVRQSSRGGGDGGRAA